MPAAEFKGVRVRGLRDLQRAFAIADKTLKVELRDALKDAGEPVRATAEQLAVARIPRVGVRWSRMRVGVTTKLVYVAPVQRGRQRGSRYRRPNLAGLLMERAMRPALEQNTAAVERRMADVLDTVGKAWERA